MFKLEEEDDIDFEEDFLHDPFNVKCDVNRVGVKGQPKFIPQTASILSTAGANIIRRSQNEFHQAKDTYTSIKETAATANTEHDDWQDDSDIDWDCLEVDNQKPKVKERDLTSSCNSNSEAPLLGSKTTKNNCISDVATRTVCTPLAPKPLQTSSRLSCRKRKFPGPAGLLPTQQITKNIDGSLSPHISMDLLASDDNDSSRFQEIDDSLLLSQISQNPFESDPWHRMQEDLDLKSNDSHVIKKFNISWVLQKASNKQLPNGKVPVLILVLKSILERGTEASVVFKDETGEMPGTIHRKVFEEFEDNLVPGAVLVVKKVSVFSPTSRKHHLIVTPANVVCLYSLNPQKPKILAQGISHLRMQVRKFALEPVVSSPSNAGRGSPSGCSPNLKSASLKRNRCIIETQTAVLSEQTKTPDVPHDGNNGDEEVIPDEVWDDFFEDIDNEAL